MLPNVDSVNLIGNIFSGYYRHPGVFHLQACREVKSGGAEACSVVGQLISYQLDMSYLISFHAGVQARAAGWLQSGQVCSDSFGQGGTLQGCC